MNKRVKIFDSIINFLIKSNFCKIWIRKIANFLIRKTGSDKEYIKEIKKFHNPELIIDIGVFKGTPDLYSVFSKSHFFLIDPIETKLISKPKKYDRFEIGISNKSGNMKFNIYENGGLSTFKKSSSKISYSGALKSEKTVQVLTLKEFIKNHCKGYKSIGLKIDVQGSELDIISSLKGIKNIKFIIIENDMINRYLGGANFSSNTAALLKCGYRLFNIAQPSTPFMQTAYDAIYFQVDDNCFLQVSN